VSKLRGGESINLDRCKTKCSQCDGDGQEFLPEVYLAFRRWRLLLGLGQGDVCSAVGILDITQLSRFENGRGRFSEQRLRDMAKYYSSVEAKV
jgi:hypothetical protein